MSSTVREKTVVRQPALMLEAGEADSSAPSALDDLRITTAILAAVTFGAFCLRMFQLEGRSVWFDEAVCWRFLQFPFAEMMSRLTWENFPPLYVVLLRLWRDLFGESLIALRGFSVLLGVIATGGMYLFAFAASAGRRGGKAQARWVGLVAASLFAVSVFQIRLAWEMRMYSLGVALAAWSSWLLLRAMSSPTPSWKLWLGYGITALLFAYTHYFALFTLAGQALFVAGSLAVASGWRFSRAIRDAKVRFAALAYGFITLGWMPWVPFFLAQRQQVEAAWWSSPLRTSNIPEIFGRLFFPIDAFGFNDTRSWIVTGLCGLAAVAILVKGRLGDWCVFCLSAVPFGLCILASVIGRNLLVDRYLAFLQPFVLVIFALLLSRITKSVVRNVFAVLLVGNGFAIYVFYMDALDIPNCPGARGAAAYVESSRGAGEPVIVSSPLLYLPLLYYAGDASNWHVYSDGTPFPHYAGAQVLIPEEVLRDDQMRMIGAGRVWLVTTSGGWPNEKTSIPPHWRPEKEKRFRDLFGMPTDYAIQTYSVSK